LLLQFFPEIGITLFDSVHYANNRIILEEIFNFFLVGDKLLIDSEIRVRIHYILNLFVCSGLLDLMLEVLVKLLDVGLRHEMSCDAPLN
jgi:hypothetical protein